MMKRKYMLIAIVLISFVIGSFYYINVAVGKVPQEQLTSISKIVYDDDITVTTLNSFIPLSSFDTEGYQYAYIMAKVTGSFVGSNIAIWILENNFGIQTFLGGGQPPYFNLNTGDTSVPNWGTGISTKHVIYAPTFDLFIRVGGAVFDGHLTIAVHLSN